MSGETINSGITSGGSFYITEYPTLDMKKATTDAGWWITDYTDDKCILSYSSVKEVITTMDLDIEAIYHTVNDETNAEYIRMRNAAAEDMINIMGGM